MFVVDANVLVFVCLLRVVRMPLRSLCRCPMMVASDGGRYFVTFSCVRPGNVRSWSLLMALINVVVGGENRHWCRYLTNSDCDVVWWTLFN